MHFTDRDTFNNTIKYPIFLRSGNYDDLLLLLQDKYKKLTKQGKIQYSQKLDGELLILEKQMKEIEEENNQFKKNEDIRSQQHADGLILDALREKSNSIRRRIEKLDHSHLSQKNIALINKQVEIERKLNELTNGTNTIPACYLTHSVLSEKSTQTPNT